MEISCGTLQEGVSEINESGNNSGTVQSLTSKSILKKKSFFCQMTDTNNPPTRDKETEVNFKDNLEEVLPNFMIGSGS